MVEGGMYVYSIVSSESDVKMETAGIGGACVCVLSLEDISAVVHQCAPVPYTTENEQMAGEWVLTHHKVIEEATRRFGTVLPMRFNTIIKGDEHTVRQWLRKNYEMLKKELEEVRGRAEFGVQIFCDESTVEQRVLENSPEISVLKQQMEKMPKGAGYLYERKLSQHMKEHVSQELEVLSKGFCETIGEHVERVKVDENVRVPDEYGDKRLVVSLSCLVHDDDIGKLGVVLDEIEESGGVSVRFTGPWAPFNFVHLECGE